ncbi:MAG: 30S ribosomal protein S20 [Fibrobacterota bacterium]
MAHHKSAIKRALTNEKQRLRNKAKKSALRNVVRKFTAAEGDARVAAGKEVCTLADHLARKNIIHKNKAARLKSRAQKVNSKKAA